MQYDSCHWACDLGQAEGGRCQSGGVPPLTKFQCIERLELNVQLQSTIMIKENHVIQHLDMPCHVLLLFNFFNFNFSF